MILLQRITSFFVAALVAGGFSVLINSQDRIVFGIALLLIIPVLFARLLKWDVKRFGFWMFLGLPTVFIFSAVFLFLFLEGDFAKWLLALSVLIGVWLYAENIFSFYHLPSTYQAYSLEYLSFVLAIATGFFFYSGTYGVQLFLQLPGWALALGIFWVTLFLLLCVFWASKIEEGMTTRLSAIGALVIAELFLALGMLPTSFLANAAGLAVALYLFIGLSRAHALDRLSSRFCDGM
ncbi:hypothetical protein HON52_04985 [Candidatus Uhrbacteria bacterium]|nr:hypothetical protein [Candidatus Uhrbacteria bacterium]